MKCSLIPLLAVMVIIDLACSSAAIAADFYIQDGYSYDYFEVSEAWFGWPSPTVDMTGGHVGDREDWNSGMYTYDWGTLNVSGGVIDYLHTYNSSTVNISGGLVSHYECMYIPTILVYDDSVINILEGAFLFGGSLHHFELYNSSIANIHGGDVALFVLAQDSSVVNVHGGTCQYGIVPYDYSTINVCGGYIDSFGMEPIPPTSTVNIHGYGFAYNPQAKWQFNHWISKLTGYGPDGTTITYWGLPDPSTSSNVNLIPDFVLGRGVDFSDFAALASAWRSSPGDDNWNQIYDISDPNDDIIDERDLAVICKFWLAGVQ